MSNIGSTVTDRKPSWAGRTFESFRVPSYRLYWGGMMGQMGAMNMQMVARSWLVYELTDQYVMLGLVMLANAVPMLFLSLFGGVMADRIQKKTVLVYGQAAFALVSLATAVAIVMGAISLERQTGVAFLMAASVVQGVVQGLMMPSRQAIIPELVGSRRLMNAVALNAAGMNINRLLAPGVAGLLIAILGIQMVYFAMTVLYVVGVVLVALLPATGTISLGARGAWGDLLEGLQYLRGNTLVIALLLLTLFSVMFSMPIMALMPAFAKDVQVVVAGEYSWLAGIPVIGRSLTNVPDLLTESSFRLGLLMSISGIGSLIGSLFVASMSNRNRGIVFLWSILLLGVTLVFYTATKSFGMALIVIVGVGIMQAARMALSNTLVQDNIDNEHRGRVMSFFMMEFGLSNFAVFGVSILAGPLGLQLAVGGVALLMIPLAGFFFLFVPSVRRLQ